MVKIKKLQSAKITSIPGGKDPILLIEEFLTQRGFQPKDCLQFKNNEIVTWTIPINKEDDLEITLEKLNLHAQTTIYFGINILAVPLKYTETFLASALIVADSLIGTKISLIGYDLVLSITHFVYNMTIEDLNYFFELLLGQQEAVRGAILEGMKIDL
jgi:hypothetical protein